VETALTPFAMAGAAPLASLQGIESRELRRQTAKQQLALAAQELLPEPEKRLPQLKGLLEFVQDEDPQVGSLSVQISPQLPSQGSRAGRPLTAMDSIPVESVACEQCT